MQQLSPEIKQIQGWKKYDTNVDPWDVILWPMGLFLGGLKIYMTPVPELLICRNEPYQPYDIKE